MATKALLILCASALFGQCIAACCGNSGNYGSGWGYGSGSGYGSGLGWSGSGGGLPVSICSAIAPTGVSVRSENSIDGNLCIDGCLPLLAAVAFEGCLPTSGSAGVQYSCGNNVGISSANGGNGGAGWGYGAGRGYGNGGCGCGC